MCNQCATKLLVAVSRVDPRGQSVSRRDIRGLAASLVAASAMAAPSGPALGGPGWPADPERRRQRREAKLARAPKLVAKAEAKRARKAESRRVSPPGGVR